MTGKSSTKGVKQKSNKVIITSNGFSNLTESSSHVMEVVEAVGEPSSRVVQFDPHGPFIPI